MSDALPPKAQLFAGPITGAVQDFIKKGTTKVLSSPKAYHLWLQINRVGHEKVVALLRGQTNGVYIQGSDVNLNLLPLVSQVLVWADGKLPGGLSSQVQPARHHARHEPHGRHPGGGELVGQAAALGLRPDHPAPVRAPWGRRRLRSSGSTG